MSGAAFKTRGATGAATVTNYWGSMMPERFNLLVPGHWKASVVNEIIYDALTPANYFNQFILDNLSYHGGASTPTGSFGATTTAPDGTATAQKFVEAATNSKHYVTAGFRSRTDQTGKLRFAAFLKYAGRRVGMEITNGTIDNDYGGATVIFDLDGGQVGVAPFSHGSFYPFPGPHSASIRSFGSGWFLCIFDVDTTIPNPLGVSRDKRCAIFLDNGEGTDAASQTYTGDGTSGVYGWRTNCLPIAAWEMNNEVYFEGFDDGLTTFDMADTRASGFKWYLNHFWPGYPAFNAMNPANVVCSGSVMTLIGGGNNYTSPGTDPLSIIQSNTYGGSPGVTRGYEMKAPFVIEARASWDYPNGGDSPNEIVGIWTAGSQGLAFSPSRIGLEVDFFELPAGGGLFTFVSPNTSVGYTGAGSVGNATIAQYTSINGYVPWYANRSYQGGYCVHYLGNFYECIGNVGPTATTPPSDPSHWQAYSLSTRNLHTPGTLSGLAVDLSAMHTYATLFIPYRKGDYGYCINFFDGVIASFLATWSPFAAGSELTHTVDGQFFGIWLNSVKTGMTLNVDSFRVTGA